MKMNKMKKKIKRRIRALLGFMLAVIFALSIFSMAAFAATMTMTMPETNIPDTDIGGATSTPESSGSMPGTDTGSDTATAPNATDSGSMTSPITLPDSSSSIMGSDTGAIENPETSDRMGTILGIIIAVIVVLAVIMLIIALMPKKAAEGPRDDHRNGGHGNSRS